MILFDRFMYVRQKRDLNKAATNTTYATKPHEERPDGGPTVPANRQGCHDLGPG